ncbi:MULTISPECIES: hypothetical protein [unclassified Nocardia]|uniref:hypothetical protein n=1 Tax=unclassified Nocardia TaxID=2637762 RepID=UPI001CE46E66|nr:MULTISPECIES: hypothetical protein [unclassified Nocardia]
MRRTGIAGLAVAVIALASLGGAAAATADPLPPCPNPPGEVNPYCEPFDHDADPQSTQDHNGN